MTPSGIEPATFRFVAQQLNHCATAVLIHELKEYLNLHNKTNKCTIIKYVLSHIINYPHVCKATLMMTAKAIETSSQLIICDKIYFGFITQV
jgi:hypothetical protein